MPLASPRQDSQPRCDDEFETIVDILKSIKKGAALSLHA
jgi:hypothetical protein